MLTIKQALQIKPVYILAVDYNSGSLADMMGEYDRDDNSHNEYLADITIQYHSLVDNACLSFTVECLVSVNDDIVTIEEMNTCTDNQAVYAHNIDSLYDGHVTIGEYGCINIDYHDKLQDLIDKQPIDDIPEHFIIETY